MNNPSPSVQLEGFPTPQQIGEDIRRARAQAQLSQKQVAVAVGCTPAYFSQIETGHSQPSVRLAIRLEQLFKLPHGALATMVFKYQIFESMTSLLRKAEFEGYIARLHLKMIQDGGGMRGRIRIE